MLYVSVLVILKLKTNSKEFLVFLDLIAINAINLVLALVASSKSDTFF